MSLRIENKQQFVKGKNQNKTRNQTPKQQNKKTDQGFRGSRTSNLNKGKTHAKIHKQGYCLHTAKRKIRCRRVRSKASDP